MKVILSYDFHFQDLKAYLYISHSFYFTIFNQTNWNHLYLQGINFLKH